MTQGLTRTTPLDTDNTLAGNSANVAPAQSAVKAYVDNRLSSAHATDLTDGGATTLHSHAGGKHTIQDEGTPLAARTNLNFVGAGVTVTDDAGNDQTDVTILNLAAAETNANDIFRVDNPGGASVWTGTISGAPSGASVTVSAPVTGTEAVLVPTSTSQLAKMRLYNLTRGDYALISNYNTGTNVITLTANAPAAWANTDSLTVASNVVSGGGYGWIDLEFTSGPTGKSSMFINLYLVNATTNQEVHMHPYEAYAASKLHTFISQAVSILAGGLTLQKITSNVVSIAWTGTPARVVVREAGYLL